MSIKHIAAGLSLAGYGALLGWAVTGDALETKMKNNQRLLADIIDRKTRELEAAKDQLLARQQEVSDSEEAIEDEAAVETFEETKEKLLEQISPYVHGEDKEAFTEMVKTVIDDESNTQPFVISKATYSYDEEGDDYAKIVLTYYPRYRILIDDDDDLIDNKDVVSMVGWRNLDRFGDESEDADTVYIRNHKLATDFEIVRDAENEPPAHIRFGGGMDRHEYEISQALEHGVKRFRRSDM